MLRVNLFFMNSDKNVINKELVVKKEMDIDLIDPTEVLHPRLKLSALSEFPTANYMEIVPWGRFYFVNNDEYAHKVGYIQCEVDPLMSFKSDIMKTEVLIDRASTGNLYLPDSEMLEYAQPYMQTFTIGHQSGPSLDIDTNQIILGITGAV